MPDAPKSVAVLLPCGEDDRLAEEGKTMGERAVSVHDERSAVEHELVLATDLVDVRERNAGFGRARSRQLEPFLELVDLERRAVRHEENLGASPSQMLADGGKPDILANWHAETNTAKRDRRRQRTWFEHALFVEDAVVGQLVLEAKLGTSVRHERGGIVQTAIGSPGQRDYQRRPPRSGLAFELAQRARGRVHERRTEDEILGWIANQDELGEDDQIGAEFSGAISRTT